MKDVSYDVVVGAGVVGKVDAEEILGSIFKDFCIGK